MDQMLERFEGHTYQCFLDGYSGEDRFHMPFRSVCLPQDAIWFMQHSRYFSKVHAFYIF